MRSRHRLLSLGLVSALLVGIGAAAPDAAALLGDDNFAPLGTGVMGTKPTLEGGPETEVPLFHVGTAENINDRDLTTRVDTYNADEPGTVSFVGILWNELLTNAVGRLDLTLATFFDGGWFGANNRGPGAGGALSTNDLVEPIVEITRDGGATWNAVPHTSDYVTALTGHGVGGGANPNPTSVTATFTLTQLATNINGIRIIGSEGGTASGGFLGVFELAAGPSASDSDNDGIEDAWERAHGLTVGTNDASADPDNDGATNLQEFTAKTDPQVADTDGDGLLDGAELSQTQTNPLRADSDADGLADGAEVNTHQTNPLAKDTDNDGYQDALEIAQNTDPRSAASFPNNLAPLGTGILGVKETLESGPETETPLFNAGSASAINDGDPTTRVDTFNGAGTQTVSFVGVVWGQPLSNTISRLQLTLATFYDGGWFGVNGAGPGSGGTLNAAEYLVEPTVQVTRNGTNNWETVAHTSDYLTALEGHALPDVNGGPPTSAVVTFRLTTPQTGIRGVRIIGTEGGTASGGFFGVFDLTVPAEGGAGPSGLTLTNAAVANNQFQFSFDSAAGTNYLVQFKNSVSAPAWQTLSTITGDGTLKQVTDILTEPVRIYRVSTQ